MTPHEFLTSSSEDEAEATSLESEMDEEAGPKRKRLKVDTSRPDADTGEERFDNTSPLTINQDEWDDIDAELKEFMGSDADSESDDESVSSKLSLRRKRKAEEMSEGPPLETNKNGAFKNGITPGGSTLTTVENVASERGSDTPDAEAIRDEQKIIEGRQEKEEAQEEDSDDELARELERELEQADDGDEEGFMG